MDVGLPVEGFVEGLGGDFFPGGFIYEHYATGVFFLITRAEIGL